MVALGSAENSQKRLLGDVLRLVSVAEKAESGIPSGTLMAAHKLLEGGQIAPSYVRH
jgi:hypothetical protein